MMRDARDAERSQERVHFPESSHRVQLIDSR